MYDFLSNMQKISNLQNTHIFMNNKWFKKYIVRLYTLEYNFFVLHDVQQSLSSINA